MLRCPPLLPEDARSTILCLGAHCDDIEIGCGGTLLKLIETHRRLEIRWVVACSSPQRERECRQAAEMLLAGAGRAEITIWQFRDGYLPYIGAEVKDAFERLKHEIAPDLIFTHYRRDLHQDHRLVNSLTWNTFRDHLVLEYEIPKYDGDFGSPNLYVALGETHCRRKLEVLNACYASQQSHRWFTEETFRSVLRLRGVEVGSASGYAEGFYARKITW
jgi:LmbE family N-acetylglucosaminyl deacetylase